MLSACYVIHLKPPLYLRNALPIDIHISVAGCSVSQTETGEQTTIDEHKEKRAIEDNESKQKEDFLDYGEKLVKPGDVLHLPTVKTTVKEGENRTLLVCRVSGQMYYLNIILFANRNEYLMVKCMSFAHSWFNIWKRIGHALPRFHRLHRSLLFGRLLHTIQLRKCRLNWVLSK